MAGEARTIRVTGLPVDGSENRLMDKLQIHFLRRKNGGGEISSVTVSKTTPGTAFVTFEESEVASRLAQREKQVFKINDKSYDITIGLHHDEVDADQVLLSMSVVVDHRMLPGGKNTLLSLHKSVPGVDLVFDDQKDVYTLKGLYSEVQSLSSLVLESLGKQESGDKPQPKTESKKTCDSPLEESSIWPNEDVRVIKCAVLCDELGTERWKTDLPLPGSYSRHSSHVALMENEWDKSVPAIGNSFEDFSLIVDSDIFRYLHKFCSKEYQRILKQHRVEVLDVNCDDITTLYLKPNTALSEHSISSVKKAHQDLAHLYQQKESQLRKEHIRKRGISEKELTHALESLRKRLPRLMIHEEDRNVYMVGSKSDVSEAKQFIGDLCGFGMEKEIHSDHLFAPSHSKFTFSKQGTTTSAGPEPHDLFLPKKDLKNANQRDIPSENSSKRGHNSVDLKHFDDHSPTGQFSFSSQRTQKPTEQDIFSLRRAQVSQARHVPGDLEWKEPGKWPDRKKYTDSLVDSSKPSPPHAIMERHEFGKADFISETTERQRDSDARLTGSETQIKSTKGCKTKQTELGKERKMAANFSRETSSGPKDLSDDKSEVPKSVEGTYVKERKFPDRGQPHSLPLIKPSMTSNLDPNALRGCASAETSTSKMEIQELKGDMSKSGHFPNPTACLSGDQGIQSFPTMSSGPTLRRTNSFSGRIKKGEETTQSGGQKEMSQHFQTREIVAMDLVLSLKLWLYINSVYNTELENLTSDLQVKEIVSKEDVTLFLTGVDSEKVAECHNSLKSLIATAEMDFDARTLPLSKFGVSDSKDKTLLELCTSIMQRYKIVKIIVLSKDMTLLGPKPLCDEIEAKMISILHKGGNPASSKLENKKSPNPDSVHTSRAPDSHLKSLGNHSTTSAKPHTDMVMKDRSRTYDQNVARSSKNVPREQDNETGSQKKMKEGKLDQLDRKDPTLMRGHGGTMKNKENGETSSASMINSATKDKADGEDNKDHTSSSAQSKKTFNEPTDPGISAGQTGDSQGTEPNPSHASGNQNLPICYVCEKEYSTVKQAECGFNFCPMCDKEVHINCKICTSSGIKGTMSVQDLTITIPGCSRDTTLKIIYDIPDGIQGEDHPCPGAPFKGNRFEAYLPHNKTTKRLLPLLEKAFHKGLTFTVKVGSSDDAGSREGSVVWGSIPHKTRTEGGAQNGYPDFHYMGRLEEALKAAGVGE